MRTTLWAISLLIIHKCGYKVSHKVGNNIRRIMPKNSSNNLLKKGWKIRWNFWQLQAWNPIEKLIKSREILSKYIWECSISIECNSNFHLEFEWISKSNSEKCRKREREKQKYIFENCRTDHFTLPTFGLILTSIKTKSKHERLVMWQRWIH